MLFRARISWWKIVLVLTVLQVQQSSALSRWSRKQGRHARPTIKPRAVVNCGPDAWSTWSKCSPFCGYDPKSTRTKRVAQRNKCTSEKQTRACDALGGCSFGCDEQLKKCTCLRGYTLIGEKECVDIDECKGNGGSGPCRHTCQNIAGTYTCKCKKGYRLQRKTACTPLDCLQPQFSNCPRTHNTTVAEANLPLCAGVMASCQNGTNYNSRCSLSCPDNYKLALKKSTAGWLTYSNFDFHTASSSIICHETMFRDAIWHKRLKDYHCRRINDPPLKISLAGTSVYEGLPPGSSVGILSTNDAQAGQTMVYSVQNLEGKSLFRCNGSLLETSIALTWQPRGQNLYPVRIRAQDNGSPPMWREEVFTIDVKNVNDAPRSIEISRNWVYENDSAGSIVGELSAIDDDIGNQRTSNFSWKIKQDDSGSFKLTGHKLVLEKTLNYDKIKLCYVKIACADEFALSTTKELPIYVRNQIDPPTISLKGDSIAENSSLGTVIAKITSKSESNENLHFTISESNPNATLRFGLSPRFSPFCEHHENAAKFNTTCYINIAVKGVLDYEETNLYTIQVYVWNSVSGNFAPWNISVLNVNEKPDKLEINRMNEIPENTKSGVDIGVFIQVPFGLSTGFYVWQVYCTSNDGKYTDVPCLATQQLDPSLKSTSFLKVSDPDNVKEITQNHSCRVINTAEDGKYFHVNAARNSLQVKRNVSLNYEAQQSYVVSVRCVDSGVPPLGITRDFIINVTDTDEPIQSMTLSHNTVRENSTLGTIVGIFDAYDPDIHQPKTIEFTLIAPLHPPFNLQGANNGTLVVNGSLNFEVNPDYVLTVRATDAVGGYLQMCFIISIIDVNEKPTDIKVYTAHMRENLVTGSFVSNITLSDEDENTLTTCSLLEDGGGRLALNETTLVAGERNTDYEEIQAHLIEISLQCCDQYKACYTKVLNISIIDENEPPTDITIDKLEVLENEKDLTIGTIAISDPDSHSDYNCAFSGEIHPYLKIINSNKTLRLIKELNFEEQPTVDFEIVCRENGSSTYIMKQFELEIVDLNEEPSDGCQMPLYVSQNQSFGTVIGSLNTSDPDNANTKDACYPKQSLTYAIISKHEIPFQILDGFMVKTGEVESGKIYTIEVSVEDDGLLFSRNFTKIQAKRKTTFFNCTIQSRPLSGPRITLSSNQIKTGSKNRSVIGYLGSNYGDKMEYELIEDMCHNYPFVVDKNKLMLMFPSYSKENLDEELDVPRYAMIMIKARSPAFNSSSRETFKRFALFIEGDDKSHRLMCFSSLPVQLPTSFTKKLGPIFIHTYNATDASCPSSVKNLETPPYYRCVVTPDLNESSAAFSRIDLTNALYVDSEMFLRVNISITKEISGLDELVLRLFCWQPDRFLSVAKGRIQIKFAYESVCEKDNQARDGSLCRDSESCSDDALCSSVVHAGSRCVPHTSQLFVVMPAFKKAALFCKFESCLQEMLNSRKTGCLSQQYEKQRAKRTTENTLYLDTLNITFLRRHDKLLLRAAVWKIKAGGQLTLVKKQDLPKLQESEGVVFITSTEDCDWFKGEDIKCPVVEPKSDREKMASMSLKNPKIQGALGAGLAILLIVVIVVFCCRKRRKRNQQAKQKPEVRDFANMAFDETELKPYEGKKAHILERKTEKKNPKYAFKNSAYEYPTELELEEWGSHIYNKAYPQGETKSCDKTKSKKAISNAFYDATDVIKVQNPQDLNYLNESSAPAIEQPHEYETLPSIQGNKIDNKQGLCSTSKEVNKNGQVNEEQTFDNFTAKFLSSNTSVSSKEQLSNPASTHYEELPLPKDEKIVNTWNKQLRPDNKANMQSNNEIKHRHQVLISQDQNLSKQEVPTYEDIAPLKNVKKPKLLSLLSKAFKNHDSKQNKTDQKNSTKPERIAAEHDAFNQRQDMLNPRDKVKNNDPANKYPFYEELPAINKRKTTESFFPMQQCGQSDSCKNQPIPFYHVLEEARNNNKDDPHYFVLEKSDSTASENKQYKSLHRELVLPSSLYTTYRLPQNSGSPTGSKVNEKKNDVS